MIYRIARALACLACAVVLAACGGGGGSAGSTRGTDTATKSPDSGSSGSPANGTSGDSAPAPRLTVELLDAAQKPVTHISVIGGFTARATIVDEQGRPVPYTKVDFAVGSGAVLKPANALTAADGVASVEIIPASVSAVGASTVTATATVNRQAVNGQRDFAISAPSLRLTDFTAGRSQLTSGGNTSLSVKVLIGESPAGAVPVNVSFTASCGRINGNPAASVTTNGSSLAEADYRAVQPDGTLCSGQVQLTASTAGAASQAVSLTVSPPEAKAITFQSASPNRIYLSGAGALESTLATFKVVDGLNNPMRSQAVEFGYPEGKNPLGLALDPANGRTDENGLVSVRILAGSLPGPVKVRARLSADPGVYTDTQYLTVASGLPSQKYMSLAVETYNIEGAVIDGISTRLTVRLADRQGNAVDDGTTVNFVAEGGQVGFSCETRVVNRISLCSVDFVSQEYRPPNGRVSVLAYTAGIKAYIDRNGNNQYDPGIDTLVNQGDPYRDDNENQRYDADLGETIISRQGNEACTNVVNDPSVPSRADTCDQQLATTARRQTVILFSSSQALGYLVSKSVAHLAFLVGSRDYRLLPMPAGTTVSALSSRDGCQIKNLSPATVPNVAPGSNEAADLRTLHVADLAGCVTGDKVIIRVRSPSGMETVFSEVLP